MDFIARTSCANAVPSKKFCPSCDKQVKCPRAIKDYFHVYFQLISLVFLPKFPSSLRDSGNFGKTLKIQVTSILNFPRAHTIMYTNDPIPNFLAWSLRPRKSIRSLITVERCCPTLTVTLNLSICFSLLTWYRAIMPFSHYTYTEWRNWRSWE